jgi:hypothetical protein
MKENVALQPERKQPTAQRFVDVTEMQRNAKKMMQGYVRNFVENGDVTSPKAQEELKQVRDYYIALKEACVKQKLFKWAGWAMEDMGEYDDALLLYKKGHWYNDASILAKSMGLHEDAEKYAELAKISKQYLESLPGEEIERILRLPQKESLEGIAQLKKSLEEIRRKDLK